MYVETRYSQWFILWYEKENTSYFFSFKDTELNSAIKKRKLRLKSHIHKRKVKSFTGEGIAMHGMEGIITKLLPTQPLICYTKVITIILMRIVCGNV